MEKKQQHVKNKDSRFSISPMQFIYNRKLCITY